MSGQAASYYNTDQRFDGPPSQQQQQQQQQYYNNGYPPAPNGGDYRGPEPKPPQPPQEPPPTYNQAVYGFDDAFKVEKPKWNDLWAGLL
ncbi:uncharacterized protein BO66DRAFT_444603, partial [Aspergillus aculeatinus CBS 121060]